MAETTGDYAWAWTEQHEINYLRLIRKNGRALEGWLSTCFSRRWDVDNFDLVKCRKVADFYLDKLLK